MENKIFKKKSQGFKFYNGELLNEKNLVVKIILWYRRKFGNDIFYSVELNKSHKISSFLLKHWALMIILIILGVSIVLCYQLNVESNIKNGVTENPQLFDLVSLLITYISSVILSIVVYYHSWAQGKIEDKRKGINLRVDPIYYYEDKFSSFYSIDEVKQIIKPQIELWKGLKPGQADYIGFTFNNLSHTSPLKIKFKYVYFLNKSNKVQKLNLSLASDYDEGKDLVEFNKPKTYFIGIDKKLITKEVFDKKRMLRCYALFEISNLDGHKALCISEMHIDSEGVYQGDYTSLLNIEKYKKLNKKYGVNFLKDISISRKIGKRFCNLINLYW